MLTEGTGVHAQQLSWALVEPAVRARQAQPVETLGLGRGPSSTLSPQSRVRCGSALRQRWPGPSESVILARTHMQGWAGGDASQESGAL